MPDLKRNPADPGEKTVAVADDDEEVRDFYQALLAREGFQVAAFQSGVEMMKRLRGGAARVDLILLDLMMAGSGGYDVIKDLQAAGYGQVPVFVATARPLDPGTVELVRAEPNVREYFVKPVDVEELTRKIHATLGTRPKKSGSQTS